MVRENELLPHLAPSENLSSASSQLEDGPRSDIIATLGPSWNFSLAENLKSLDLQDGPRKWHYFSNSYHMSSATTYHMSSATTHPPSRPTVNVCDMEYLSDHWTDLPQILNLSLGDQTEIKKILSKWRRPPMEEDLKILKVEYLSNHSSDPPQILNLSSGDQTKIKNAWNEDDLQWKTTSKY